MHFGKSARATMISLSVLALAACGPGEDNSTPQDGALASDPAMEASDAAMDAEAMATSNAQAFADAAAASDMFELESSKLAASMASDPKVKAFAEMMVTGHTKSSADLKAAAGKAVPAVVPAAVLKPDQQTELDSLKNARANFDVLYMAKQVAAHEKALSMLEGYASGGDSEPLMAFAKATAPVVAKHLEEARAIKPAP